MSWQDDQQWESDWWGNCSNTLNEELKQIAYARKMGLHTYKDAKTPYNIEAYGNILDVGGGPVSMLLKCPNIKDGTVVDPCEYPEWVYQRYGLAEIDYIQIAGEDIDKHITKKFDEIWIYNCLQHTQDPEKICKNALNITKIIRIFEWVDTGTAKGHPHNLTKELLDTWLEGTGKVDNINEHGAVGKCYYGIFKGKLYEEI